MVLKVCFYVGMSLCRLCIFSVFGARAGFGMPTSHVIPQGVLSVSPLIGVWSVLYCPEPGLGVRWGLLSAPWLSLPCRGRGLCSPVVGVEALRVEFDQALLLLSVCPKGGEC